MFITKKKFEEAICKAKAEVEKEIWERERLDRMERNIHERIDHLQRRVYALERESDRNVKCEGHEENVACIPDPY